MTANSQAQSIPRDQANVRYPVPRFAPDFSPPRDPGGVIGEFCVSPAAARLTARVCSGVPHNTSFPGLEYPPLRHFLLAQAGDGRCFSRQHWLRAADVAVHKADLRCAHTATNSARQAVSNSGNAEGPTETSMPTTTQWEKVMTRTFDSTGLGRISTEPKWQLVPLGGGSTVVLRIELPILRDTASSSGWHRCQASAVERGFGRAMLCAWAWRMGYLLPARAGTKMLGTRQTRWCWSAWQAT